MTYIWGIQKLEEIVSYNNNIDSMGEKHLEIDFFWK